MYFYVRKTATFKSDRTRHIHSMLQTENFYRKNLSSDNYDNDYSNFSNPFPGFKFQNINFLFLKIIQEINKH